MSRERSPMVLNGVIGDVLDPFTATTELRVYNDGRNLVSNGCSLRPSQVANRPRVEVGDDFRTYYTLILVDADAPSPGDPYFREYLHWLVCDIPGSTGANFGREIVSYEGPHPSIGIHRLVLVLFQQPGRMTVHAPQWRQNFSVREFSQQYNLGSPAAAVYYNCLRESGAGGRRSAAP